jgi:hypothetical protein
MNIRTILYFFFFTQVLVACRTRTCQPNPEQVTETYKMVRTNDTKTFPSKLWLHRTNTLSKYKQHLTSYSGFELDVNIDTLHQRLDVYHPPEKTKNLNFESYLKFPGSGSKYFWLDLKNLKRSNAKHGLHILEQLNATYIIKERIVVESPQVELLEPFMEAGYHCVWYLVLPKLDGTCKDTVYANQILNRFSPQLMALSAEGKYIPRLNAYFPHCKKVTWSTRFLDRLFTWEKHRLLADSSVLIVLEKRFK